MAQGKLSEYSARRTSCDSLAETLLAAGYTGYGQSP